MKIALYVCLLILCPNAIVVAQEATSVTKVLPQAASPVRIAGMKANYISSSSRYLERGIHYSLDYENTSTRNIVAIEFGLVAFDIWNEFLDRNGGITMTPVTAGGKANGEWVASRYADFSFHTGVAYVSKVRFEDGEIWKSDTAAILLEMRKIQKDFDATRLNKRSDDKP